MNLCSEDFHRNNMTKCMLIFSTNVLTKPSLSEGQIWAPSTLKTIVQQGKWICEPAAIPDHGNKTKDRSPQVLYPCNEIIKLSLKCGGAQLAERPYSRKFLTLPHSPTIWDMKLL